jgi:hypothetical protein
MLAEFKRMWPAYIFMLVLFSPIILTIGYSQYAKYHPTEKHVVIFRQWITSSLEEQARYLPPVTRHYVK